MDRRVRCGRLLGRAARQPCMGLGSIRRRPVYAASLAYAALRACRAGWRTCCRARCSKARASGTKCSPRCTWSARRGERERGLADALARMRRAVQALPDGVVILDGANRIEWCNRTAERQLMLDARADLGQNIANLVREPGVRGIPARAAGRAGTRHPRAGHRAVATANPRRRRRSCCSHAMLRRPSASTRCGATSSPMCPTSCAAPLTVLVGFLETVRELKLNPQRQRDYLAMMQEQAARMQRIIDDLLTLSALDAAPPASSDRRVAVRPLLERLKADAEALSGGSIRSS